MRALLAAMLVLAGCANVTTVGRPFDPKDVEQLTEGVSTLKDAEGIFGPPQSCRPEANGSTSCVWMYGTYNKYKSASSNPPPKTMQIFFDKDGKYTAKPF